MKTTATKESAKEVIEHAELLNGLDNQGKLEVPYIVQVEIVGSCPLIFHKWNVEEVAIKAAAKKGSKEKKTDNIESFIYRDNDGDICLPGEYLRMAMCYAAKFRQDPRSPKKSAFDLFKAGLVSMTELAKVNGGSKTWDFIDQRRVVVQRNAITRMRPAFLAGWSAEIEIAVGVPEYIDTVAFREVLEMAGRLIGVGDFRPSYGRFQISHCKVKKY